MATQVTQVNAAKLVPYWKASAQVIATPAPCEYAYVYCQQPNSICCEDGKEYPCIGGQHDEQNEKEHDASCQKCKCQESEYPCMTCKKRGTLDKYGECTCCKNCGKSKIGNSCECCEICGVPEDFCLGCCHACKEAPCECTCFHC